jgi:hypothetical protein
MKKLIRNALKLFAEMTENDAPAPGLNHSLRHLISIRNEIPYWNIERQAKYADKTCMETVEEQGKWLKDNGLETVRGMFDYWNTTSVGNMAYVALNHSDPKIRDMALMLLKNYQSYHLIKKA